MSYICGEIAGYLSRTPSATYRRTGAWKDTRYALSVVVPAGTPADAERMLDYLEGVVRWVSSLRWSASVSSVDLELACTPFPKRWDWQRSSTIGRCEVNSGETDFPSASRRQIRIWRREDWSKVALHELLHAFMWDRLVPSSREGESEALVEAVAVLLHSILLGGSTLGAARIMEDERRWMLAQSRALHSRRWTAERTHVRSYYMLKTALLAVPESYADFASWITGPSEADLRRRWPELADRAMERLFSILARPTSALTVPEPTDDAERRMEMHMVRNQLSLTPRSAHPSPRSAGYDRRHRVSAGTRNKRSRTAPD